MNNTSESGPNLQQWQKTVAAIGGTLVLLALLLVWRWAYWESRQMDIPPVDPVAVNVEDAASRLAAAVRIKTISHQDPAQFDGQVFEDFHAFLAESFPLTHKAFERETVSKYSLLYRLQGTESGLKPLLFTGHLDVVPVSPGTELNWERPAFTGVIDGGFVWGRGSLDDKGSVMAIFEALEILAEQGYRPKRTIYLAFGHDEEIGGYEGAGKMAKLLEERGEQFMLSLDEGSAITDGVVKGLPVPAAFIGVAEKGYLTLRLVARGKGGHSSAPPAHTSVGLIARAITRLEASPFDAKIRPPVSDMMDYLAPELDFWTGIKYANRWLFGGSIRRTMEQSPGSAAMLRTTLAATMSQAGVKENVLPETARAIVNLRVMSGETVAGTISRLEEVIDDPKVRVETLTAFEPAPVSSPSSESFQMIHKTIAEIFPEVVVSPGLVRGSTDSKHYVSLADHTYRFTPVTITPDDFGRVHGTNERISIKSYGRMIQYYARLFENTAGRAAQ
jgi:carboxypeptidase PM20D1